MASTGASENLKIGTVCVVGASGFCASWLVMRLLERGYKVRATVRDPENAAKTSHLRALPAATERLEIVKAELLNEEDFVAALSGCDGVFLVATPIFYETDNPERDMIRPAVQGTINVLKACLKSPCVRRVVYTSSIAAVGQRPANEVPSDFTFDESSWSSVEYCRALKSDPPWASSYSVSKTLAEQAAFDFAQQNGLDVVSIVPSLVVGAFLTPKFPNSVRTALAMVTGESQHFPFLRRNSYVDVDDLARAHIFVYENPSAQGRYVCSMKSVFIHEVAQMLKLRYPELPVVTDNQLTYRLSMILVLPPRVFKQLSASSSMDSPSASSLLLVATFLSCSTCLLQVRACGHLSIEKSFSGIFNNKLYLFFTWQLLTSSQ